MNTASRFLFFENVTSIGTSNTLWNTKGSELILDVSSIENSTFSIKIQGKINAENDNWVDLYYLNISDLSTGNLILKNGGYSIIINGIMNIRCEIINLVGNLNVFGIITE